jgi:D-alanyl-D-alanine carboxypeptidase
MNTKIRITALVMLVFGASFAQSLNTVKLDSLFQILETKDKFMGSITVSEKGKTIYGRSVGKADVETGKKNTKDTKFRIGSVTKMFTASLVLKAVEEGKLSLGQTIDKYFPTVKNANKITIEHLLYHRSGIYNFTNSEDLLQYYTQPKSKKEMVEIIANGKSDFEPGTSSDYSNSNYVLLSFILEESYGKPYSVLLNEKIVKPLGLKNTYFGHKTSLKDNEAYSYSNSGKWVKEKETDMSIPMGAGGIISNPGDLAVFIESLFAGKIVSLKSLEQMLKIKDRYGMGIVPYNFYDKIGYGHSGLIDGSTSALYYFPADKLSIAITSNGDVLGVKYLLKAVASNYYHKDFEMPSFNDVALKPEELDPYLGVYSSPELPDFSLIITKDNTTLMAQGPGESAIPMEATGKDKFEFLRAGIKLVFKPAENQMLYSQNGQNFTLTRK